MKTLPPPCSISLPGALLRRARVALNWTLLDASHATKISPRNLQLLEADDFTSFGSLAYARAFLRTYGRVLDVDVQSTLDVLSEQPQPAGSLSGKGFVAGSSVAADAVAMAKGKAQQVGKWPTAAPAVGRSLTFAIALMGLWIVQLAGQRSASTTDRADIAPTNEKPIAVQQENHQPPSVASALWAPRPGA